MQGYTILQNAVKNTYIWKNRNYKDFWIDIMMQVRPQENTLIIRGKQVILPPHTVCISVYKTGIPGLTEQKARTMLKKLEADGYIKVCTVSRRTYITILDTDLYKYPKTKTKTNTAKSGAKQPEIQSDDFDYINKKIEML